MQVPSEGCVRSCTDQHSQPGSDATPDLHLRPAHYSVQCRRKHISQACPQLRTLTHRAMIYCEHHVGLCLLHPRSICLDHPGRIARRVKWRPTHHAGSLKPLLPALSLCNDANMCTQCMTSLFCDLLTLQVCIHLYVSSVQTTT